MPEPIKKNLRYMPGLDGLRALALMGVMGYHWGLESAPGGFLGVGVFFVLSGYLITDILASQWRLNGKINLADFWYRRFRRLLPAMFLMLLMTVVWVTLFDPSRLAVLRQDVIGAVTYLSNWQFIFREVSYFESFGPPSPLGHMWSLAVEEQFYVIWPLILLIGLYLYPRRGQMLYFISALAGISALLMMWIYEPGEDPSRVYFGTDTRAFGLLIGAALAIMWPSFKLSSRIARGARILMDLAGISALVLILYMMGNTDRFEEALYPGGMVILSLASAVVIAVLAHPASLLGNLIGAKPLRWVGVRSYGIYLWHYPIIMLTSPNGDVHQISPLHAVLQVAASVALAALSWKYVEEPIRRGALKAWWKGVRQPNRVRRRPTFKNVVLSCSTLLLIGIFTAGMTYSVSVAETEENRPPVAGVGAGTGVLPPPADLDPPAEPTESKPVEAKPENPRKPDQPEKTEPEQTDKPGTGSAPPAAPPAPSKPAPKPPQKAPAPKPGNATNVSPKPNTGKPGAQKPQAGSSVTVIGDSVMVGVSPYLEKALPGIRIDAKIGRQLVQAKDIVSGLKTQGRLDGGVIVIALGTNGTFAKKELHGLLKSLSSAKQVILVNTKVPRDWERSVNALLAEIGPQYPNTTVVDWHAASKEHPEFFRSDRVHLEPEGAKIYSALIVNAIKK